MIEQQELFRAEAPVEVHHCLSVETTSTLSHVAVSRTLRRMVKLAERVAAAEEPLERARFGAALRDLAESVVASSIRDANRGGVTWRDIGAELGAPFQTLYRRYGGEG
jgi:hypothetical protein